METFEFFLTNSQLKKVSKYLKKNKITVDGGMVVMQVFHFGGIVKGAFFERCLASEIQETIKNSMEIYDEDHKKE